MSSDVYATYVEDKSITYRNHTNHQLIKNKTGLHDQDPKKSPFFLRLINNRWYRVKRAFMFVFVVKNNFQKLKLKIK